MRLGSAAMTTAVMCAWPGVAHAQEIDIQAEREWAVALGMGWMGGAVGIGAQPLGGLPIFSATLERRLDDRLWAMVRANGSYTGARFGDATDRHWELGGSVGLRHALTPPDPLEVSWYAALDGSYARASLADMDAWTAGLRLGVALDKHFNEWFGLRVSLDVARFGYQRAQATDALGAMVPTESWYANVTLAPSVALRFAF